MLVLSQCKGKIVRIAGTGACNGGRLYGNTGEYKRLYGTAYHNHGYYVAHVAEVANNLVSNNLLQTEDARNIIPQRKKVMFKINQLSKYEEKLFHFRAPDALQHKRFRITS